MKIGLNGAASSGGGCYLSFANGNYVYGLNVRKADDGQIGSGGQPGAAAVRMYDSASQPYWDFDDLDDSLGIGGLDGGFHTYRWEILAGDPTDYNFTVDGIPGPLLAAYQDDAPDWVAKVEDDQKVYFGDTTSKAGGKEIWYDYIRITNVPEPVTLAILMIGGLAALARRRK